MRNVIKFLTASLFMASLDAHSLTISGNDAVGISGSEGTVYVRDQSTLTAEPNSDIAWMYGYDNSTININGGETSWLYGYENSEINVSGGDISWLKLYDNNVTNISYLHDLSWLLVNDASVVNIYGSNFDYSGGHLSGTWGNGHSFSFWALEETDLGTGNIGHLLPDNIILHSVPEPSSVALMVFGLAALGYRKLKK